MEGTKEREGKGNQQHVLLEHVRLELVEEETEHHVLFPPLLLPFPPKGSVEEGSTVVAEAVQQHAELRHPGNLLVRSALERDQEKGVELQSRRPLPGRELQRLLLVLHLLRLLLLSRLLLLLVQKVAHQWRPRFFPQFRTSAVAMDGDRGSGAALRRRERRLRAWQRHLRTAVQLALAESLHHSANKVEPHDALRGQRMRAGREEVECVTHFGPRSPMTPPPEARPGLPPEPRPQRSDRTVRHSSGASPSLSPPQLADAVGDAVDQASVDFLLRSTLAVVVVCGGGGGGGGGGGCFVVLLATARVCPGTGLSAPNSLA